MPAQRPRALFEPIPHNLDLNRLVESQDNFRFVDRIGIEQVNLHGADKLEKLVLTHVIMGGKPLILDGFDTKLDPWTFTPRWLRDNVGDKIEQSRDLVKKENIPLTIGHYLKNIPLVANQHFKPPKPDQVGVDKSRQRIYLKDIDCPQVWHDKLKEQVPPFLYYLNESTGDVGGPGASLDPSSTVPGRRLGRGLAKAGDLMSSLPQEMRAENMMCYIGHEGTYTPTHREMCATLGQNVMVEASGELGEDGKPEKPGSSIWFMTETNDRHTAAEYWLSKLGHDIEVENHFAQIGAWQKAPFTVYVVEQKPGDFILIPPLAPHQVWNRGTRTMKVAWNRTTVETLELAINEALPKARIVCRDEQYKNKAIIYFTLNKYSDLLRAAKSQADTLPPAAAHSMLFKGKVKQLFKDFKRIFLLFKAIMLSETFSPDVTHTHEKCELLPFDSNVTCAYCRGNIFNRFLSCPTCKDALGHGEDEPYDVCMECYTMGRSCYCISGLQWMEQFPWKELTGKYDEWRKQIVDFEGDVNQSTPLSLAEERKRYPKKTLAEVCREQLKRRPFVDITKPKEPEDGENSDEEIIVDDEGRVKKTVKKRSKAWLKNNSVCHVCNYRHPNWKMARCTRCDRGWCYGSLFRGHDDMPLDIMEHPDWECAHCQGVCFAGACRKDPRQNPYQPKGTLLGHDTKKVADARSVEALVDFAHSNLGWLREDENEDETPQMRRAREEADRAKEANVEIDDDDEGSLADAAADDTQMTDDRNEMLDPALRDDATLAGSSSRLDSALPPPSAMVQGAPFAQSSLPLLGNDTDGTPVPDGYAPATTAGLVAPTAPMHPRTEDNGYLYPDPSDMIPNDDGDYRPPTTQFRPFGKPHGKKRPRKSDGDVSISMENPKKRRVTEDAANLMTGRPRNEATKQFEREKERKALEEAKKQGRFFAVSAALRGKKKIIRLKVPGSRLAQLVARQAARHIAMPTISVQEVADESADEMPILQSDVTTKTVKPKARAKPVNPNKAKVRVEKDEEFSTRSDRHGRNAKAGHVYEEVDILSDDDEDDDLENIGSGQNGTSKRAPDGGRRISAYLQARHEDDPDLPDELPEDYRDRRGDKTKARQSLPAGTSAPIARTSNGNFARAGASKPSKTGRPSNRRSLSQLDGVNNDADGDDAGELAHVKAEVNKQIPADLNSTPGARPTPQPQPQRKQPSTAKPSPAPKPNSTSKHNSTEEENRLAKLQALKMTLGDISDEEDEYSASPSPEAEPVSNVAVKTAIHRSIFDRKGTGKGNGPIRIVSAAAALAAKSK